MKFEMKGIILINAYLDSREYLYEAERLQEEFSRLHVSAEIKRIDDYPLIIADGKIKNELADFDFCV